MKARLRCYDAPLTGDALRAHAREWAEFPVNGWAKAPDGMSALKDLRDAVAQTQRAAMRGEELLPASAWLLDNFPMLEEAALRARGEAAAMRLLPAMGEGACARLPRAYMIAAEVVAHTDARVDEAVLECAAQGYLTARRLTMRELWCLPHMARAALLSASAETARACAQAQRERRLADAFADEVIATRGQKLDALPRGLSGAFVERLLARLREEEGSALYKRLADRLKALDMPADRAVPAEHARQTDAQMRMGNAVLSLRALDALDWAPIYERLCPVEQLLRQEAAGVYSRMDFASREAVRRAVERMAGRLRMPEAHVARVAVKLADAASGREGHVCYHLCGGGEEALEEAVTGKPARRVLPAGARGALYMAAIVLAAAGMTLAAALALGWPWALLLLIPFFGAAQTCASWAVTKLVRPAQLLALDYEEGIPPESATLIVVPTLLNDIKRVPPQLRQLECHWLANRGPNLQCMLLADFGDADAPSAEGDEAVIEAARQGIRALNGKYGAHFSYLHRPRVYCETQGRYMGRERKRGALCALNGALISGDFSAFRAYEGALDTPAYILTLDADTVLAPGDAAKLAGTLAHPLNRAGADGRGYALLAPRVGTLLGPRTRFARLYGGDGGVDAYASRVSDVYQDLFGQGSFQGKGIYDLRAFSAALEGVLPDNAILSHDLIEGIYAKAGLCSDVEVYDGVPAHLPGFYQRQHRWIRGDWQLLPIILRDKSLSALDRWKLIDNLRRPLEAPCVMLALLLGAWLNPLAALLALGAYLFPLVPALPALLSGEAKPLKQTLARLSALPYEAHLSLDAVLRTLVRLKTGKNLLSWVTAADAERGVDPQSGNMRRMWACLLAAALLCFNPYFLPLAALFAAAPAIAYILAQPVPRPRLGAQERAYLEDVARRTYRWFTTFDTDEDNHLPPDNVQEEPARGVTHRTSPTNIGLKLGADLAALDLEFITAEQFLERTERTISALEKLETWHGHPYNWYDTRTLEALRPRYVSSVDGGNLAACLLALSQACAELDGPEGLRRQADDLRLRCDALTGRMDFSLLYSRQRRLFHIGYDAEAHRLGDSYYDLLASESRLLSYVAIAQGQVPARHFKAPGRPLTGVKGRKAMLSWGGTMFEYLMPQLFLPSFEGSLIDESCAAAVLAQRAAAEGRPWGESESGYYAFDLALNYQYKAFGVPGLMLKGGVQDETVVAPYATALALLYDPKAAAANLKRLEARGLLSPYGFYEAEDYTRARLGAHDKAEGEGEAGQNARRPAKSRVVKSHMAHHQGMTLCALEGALEGRGRARFARIPAVRAYQVLLNERTPRGGVKPRHRPARSDAPNYREARFSRSVSAARPDAALLSGGHTALNMDMHMRGAMRWRSLSLNRCDAFRPTRALALFIGDKPFEPDKVVFDADRAVFSGEAAGLQTEVTVAVSPEDGAVVWSVRLSARGGRARAVSITAYMEPSLSSPDADRAHRAFQNLFMELSCPCPDAVLALRRPREGDEIIGVALVASGDGEAAGVGTDRFAFLGRGVRPMTLSAAPSAEHCLALARRVSVKPEGQSVCAFSVVPCPSREASDTLIRRYASYTAVERALDMAHTRVHVEAAYMGLTPHMLRRAGRAAALLLSNDRASLCGLSAERSTLAQNGLFRYGLSGELPIMAARIGELEHARLARELLRMHGYLREKGLICDLVLINDYGNDYMQPVRDKLQALIDASHARELAGVSGGVFIIPGAELNLGERALILSRAGLVLDGAEGGLDAQLARLAVRPALPPEKDFDNGRRPPLPLPAHPPLMGFNGYGGFAEDGRYVIDLPPGVSTPSPWSNVLAGEGIGAVITERGGGYTFAANSREHKLTPWCNDPVCDTQGEAVYVRDELSGAVYNPMRMEGAHVRVTHAQGFSAFETGAQGLFTRVTVFADVTRPRLFKVVEFDNPGASARTLTVTAYAEWVLGAHRHLSAPSTVTSYHAESGVICARNPFTFPGVAYLAAPRADIADFTCSRREFMGECLYNEGGVPDALKRDALSRAFGGGMDPCAALRARVRVPAGGAARVVFVLGREESAHEAVDAAREADADGALERVRALWAGRLGAVRIRTPDPLLDVFVNCWLPYQTWASRFLARTAFYQAGGAYGFRDQLQDALMFVYAAPETLKAHILRAAAHQFEEGDVQHWWHEPASGVRTRMSDDLLFLPYAACEYARRTGDNGIFDLTAPFLRGAPVPEGREDLYYEPETTQSEETLYEHCVRAVDRALDMGAHGLPKMGGGDWNDGMNAVGTGGAGESVWLGFFLYAVLEAMRPVCAARGDEARAAAYAGRAAALREALEEHGWDGEWYRRAYFDDGAPLGSKGVAECAIDGVAQAWAALSGAADKDRARAALDAAMSRLFDRTYGIFKLLDPPFDGQGSNPGYIRGYLPGVRENGGQYTHAAAWMALALCETGDKERAWELVKALLPMSHASDAASVKRYMVEPYVAAADVYAGAMPGRGGWTWYTGSAAWLWRAVVEGLLGLRLENGQVSVDRDGAPKALRGYEIEVVVNGDAAVNRDN